jgi:hypothetical protein
VQVVLPPHVINKMKPENLLHILLDKCSKEVVDNSKVRLSQLQKKLNSKLIPSEYTIEKYVRGKYPKIIGVILKNKLYLPVYPESIKTYQLNHIIGISDLKRNNLLSLSQYLKHHQILQNFNRFFKYLKVKHIFQEDDTEEKEGLGFIRLEGETLIPIQKIPKNLISLLKEHYSEEEISYIMTGIHPSKSNKKSKSTNRFEFNQQKLDEFSIDDLIFDQELPEDERTQYIKNYRNNEKEFKNIILGVNSYLTYEKNKTIAKDILKIILNPVLPNSLKRKEIGEIFKTNHIFHKLFIFTDRKYFKKKVPIITCYQVENVSQCKKDSDKKYKIPITDLNLVNGMPNYDLFQNLIIEEMIRNVSYGKKLLTQKIEEYELKSLGSIEKKDQLIFGADSLERIFHKLYSKRKVKFLRDVEDVETKKKFTTVDYSPINTENLYLDTKNLELAADSLAEDDTKIKIKLQPKKTKKLIQKKISKKSILVAQNNQTSNLKVHGSNKDMFGLTDADLKVKSGECIFPFNMTTRHKVEGKNVARPWYEYRDCVVSKDGAFCPTEVKRTKKAVQGKLKKLAEYQEIGKHPSKKGYCLWNDFFERELRGRLKGKKNNPNCQEEYMIQKDTGDGKKKLINIKGCIPDQVANIDVENPRYVCPNKKEVKKGELFLKSKHQQEDCYI